MWKNTILIDGFNLFYRWKDTSESFRTETNINKAVKQAISALASFLSAEKNKYTVIIDGGKKAGNSLQSGLKVEYSGPGKTADEIIINKVKNSKNPKSISVITTDHTLGGNARFLGAKVLSVESFLNNFRHSGKRGKEADMQPRSKFIKPSAKEVEEWLEIFGDGKDILEEEI